jgi:hypothetical protein
MESAQGEDAHNLDYLTSNVALAAPENGSTDLNVLIDHHCMYDELCLWMPECSLDSHDEGDKHNKRNAIPTLWPRCLAVTELVRLDLRTSTNNWYESKYGNDVNVDIKEDASQADDESTDNLENSVDDGDVDGNEAEEAWQANDRSTQNLED